MTTTLIAPPPLQRGDTIGIIAPAGQLAERTRFERGVALLAEMGFEARFPRDMWPGTGYLADTDSNRVQELHKVFADADVQGVMAARGGYGCLRILPKTDFRILRKNPKLLVGFSDITVLLNQAAEQAGLITFHGPVVTTLSDCTPETIERLYSCLTGNWRRAISPARLEVLRGAEQVQGKLIGGNLASLVTMLGTPFDCSWQGCIVVLEDIGEPLYRLDRMLTQLGLSGRLAEPAGIILGDFTLDSNQGFLEKNRYTEYIWQRVLDLTAHTGIPVWGNFPIGHCPHNLTLPMGATAVMDCAQGELRFH